MSQGGIILGKINARRSKSDAVALASKGRVTTQIETQKSGDKPIIVSTLEEN